MSSNVENFNEDELHPPEWLNFEFFDQVLKQAESTAKIKVKSLKIQPASLKGDHMASIIFRATINYQIENEDQPARSLIVKTLPECEGKRTGSLHQSKAFETEIAMYLKVIPKFEEILQIIGDDMKFGARCVYHALTPNKVIIFEDIVPLGYTVMRDRKPNLTEAKAIFTKLAKWHAISQKINFEDAHFFDEFCHGFFMEPNLGDVEPYYEGFSNFLDLLEEYTDLRQYKPFFETCNNKIVDDIVKGFHEALESPQSNGIYGLCHSDFHNKNLMFKKAPNTDNLIDVKLLDFQFCYLGPLANDIIYATYMMFDADMRANHLDELYDFYFNVFQETLKKIDFKGHIPKIVDFRKQLVRHKKYELLLLTVCLPMWYAVSEAIMDIKDLIFDKEKRKVAWKNPIYVKEVKELLPKLKQKGYLEID